jgi:hypothetical protein
VDFLLEKLFFFNLVLLFKKANGYAPEKATPCQNAASNRN